jgi:hypothetical protein
VCGHHDRRVAHRSHGWGNCGCRDASAPEGAPEGIRTPNLLIRWHRPIVRPGTIRNQLSCRWRWLLLRRTFETQRPGGSYARGCRSGTSRMCLFRDHPVVIHG